MPRGRLLPLLFVVACCACSDDPSGGDGAIEDAANVDGGFAPDADETDSGQDAQDSGDPDTGDRDAEPDGGSRDAAPADGDLPDADPADADPADADPIDADEPDAAMDAGTADSGVTGISALNDELNDPATLSDWTQRYLAEGTPLQHGTLDIGATVPGRLTIVPNQTARWHNTDRSIFLYKMVTGDFVMRTRVRAVQAADPSMPPFLMFNAGGILARDPASATTGENWVLLTMGYQAVAVGTRDAATGGGVTSLQSIRASSVSEGELVICRLGAVFHTYYTTDNKSGLTRTNSFTHVAMPQTLQVGMAIEAGGTQPHLRAEFDWIRFAVPTQMSDCTLDVPPN